MPTLRDEMPVFGSTAYLNAGTCGPQPEAALAATRALEELGLRSGRGTAYFGALVEVRPKLRAAYAARLHAAPEDVAVTTATSDGMVRVLAALGLQRGDEVLTATREHPGLLGPLAGARRELGITVREVPLERIHEELSDATRLVACSHVSWTDGRLAPAELAEVGTRVPVLLDGAQGAGAIDVDVEALGCAFYAAAGQKWLCGPMGTGLLWIAPAWRERLAVTGPLYPNLEVPSDGLDAEPFADARAFDAAAIPPEALAGALAAHDALEDALGWPEIYDRAADGAAALAARLEEAGRVVAPRDHTTLVSFEDPDPAATVERLAAAGVVVRSLPGTPYIRASVGAWNEPEDVDRLLAGLG